MTRALDLAHSNGARSFGTRTGVHVVAFVRLLRTKVWDEFEKPSQSLIAYLDQGKVVVFSWPIACASSATVCAAEFLRMPGHLNLFQQTLTIRPHVWFLSQKSGCPLRRRLISRPTLVFHKFDESAYTAYETALFAHATRCFLAIFVDQTADFTGPHSMEPHQDLQIDYTERPQISGRPIHITCCPSLRGGVRTIFGVLYQRAKAADEELPVMHRDVVAGELLDVERVAVYMTKGGGKTSKRLAKQDAGVMVEMSLEKYVEGRVGNGLHEVCDTLHIRVAPSQSGYVLVAQQSQMFDLADEASAVLLHPFLVGVYFCRRR